ncbi:MAG: hypothetical protein OHK93_005196 [Ramalina farinacea]|uniref:FAD-binding PCMH-type domain-containing protein n=1 Tax=Ramalina farinacea TaxID=258253 RepID=A0AA43QVY1_9LECA|nr:hypothetical protein [Ramalina farinacea]
MTNKLDSFFDSLALPSSQAQSLSNAFAGNSNLKAFLGGSSYNSSDLVGPACKAAEAALGSDVVQIQPVGATEIDLNWSQTCWAAPTCVVLPRSSQDVSKALKIINFFQVKFAVRSGGHSPNPGWSSINNPGLLIDLQRFNQVTINSDRSVASLGPGGRWGDVYAALDPYGVVLADGTITDANAQQNTDLFWALKGGGPNFGIVTRFDLHTIPVHDIWYQVTVYTPDQAPAILEAFAEWQEKGASDLKSTVALIIALETVTVGLIYSAPAEKPSAFSPFDDLPAGTVAVPATNGTVLSLTTILGTTFSNEPLRHDYYGASSKIDIQLYKDVYVPWREKALAAHTATGANITFTLQPIPVNLVNQGIAKGGNPLGLPQINHQWWTTLVDWQHAADDEAVRAVSIDTSSNWKNFGQQRGSYIPFLDMNDASREQNPLASYGSENVAKLKAVSQKYDAAQLFQKLQNDGFLLSRVDSGVAQPSGDSASVSTT